MALIKDRKTKSNGSYERLLNNKKLGDLIAKVHASSIANGIELEEILILRTNKIVVRDVEEFERILKRDFNGKEVFLVPKKIVKKSSVANKKEPDFLIITKFNDCLNIIELKDGWTFDTKKSPGEYKQLLEFQNDISKIVSYKTQIFMCSFSSNDKEQIYNGFKKKIPKENIMTGIEFCNLINVNYEEIKEERKRDSKLNFDYFIEELLLIEEVKEAIMKKIDVQNL